MWVNLYNFMLEPFKEKDRCVTMDSAYISDITAQIGQFKWGKNMVGTAQVNQSGAYTKAIIVTMTEGIHESVM